ncbi:MAG: polysaccharide deacetylase family protein [Betaproteobacteria bacterium]|nr:polysaccharide deacetylase family protein [Betaproteobacteria bacterium]
MQSEVGLSEASRALQAEIEQADAQAPGRWRPAPFIRFSFVLHGLALLALAFEPAWWPWVIGVLVADHGLMCLAVPFTRGGLIGANLTRLPQAAAARGEVAITFDDGPNPAVTPQVMDLLEGAGMRATFFCIGANVQKHPELVREIVRRGHQVENHSDRHSVAFSFYGYGKLAREVDAAQAALIAVTEQSPRFFRAPAGIRNPFLDPILQHRGMRYISWTRRGYDAVDRDAGRVLARLTRKLAAGDVLLLHDGGPAHTAEGVPLVLAVLPALLGRLREHGLRCVPLATAFVEPAK